MMHHSKFSQCHQICLEIVAILIFCADCQGQWPDHVNSALNEIPPLGFLSPQQLLKKIRFHYCYFAHRVQTSFFTDKLCWLENLAAALPMKRTKKKEKLQGWKSWSVHEACLLVSEGKVLQQIESRSKSPENKRHEQFTSKNY